MARPGPRWGAAGLVSSRAPGKMDPVAESERAARGPLFPSLPLRLRSQLFPPFFGNTPFL